MRFQDTPPSNAREAWPGLEVLACSEYMQVTTHGSVIATQQSRQFWSCTCDPTNPWSGVVYQTFAVLRQDSRHRQCNGGSSPLGQDCVELVDEMQDRPSCSRRVLCLPTRACQVHRSCGQGAPGAESSVPARSHTPVQCADSAGNEPWTAGCRARGLRVVLAFVR